MHAQQGDTVLGLCVCVCVCVCIQFSYHALPIVQQDVLSRSADHGESFKFDYFSKNALFRSYGVFKTFLTCVCGVSV